MKPTISLRASDSDDAGFLFRVFSESHGPALALSTLPEAQRDPLLRLQFEAQLDHYRRTYPAADFDIVLSGPQRIGYMTALRGPAEFVLVDIALLSAFRGRGIGSKLVSELIDLAQSENKPLSAHVLKNSTAWELWKRLGFRRVADDGVQLEIEVPA